MVHMAIFSIKSRFFLFCLPPTPSENSSDDSNHLSAGSLHYSGDEKDGVTASFAETDVVACSEEETPTGAAAFDEDGAGFPSRSCKCPRGSG
ncbi:hypothetical protein HPP92_007435 [Vanilla planifolia]|uniref:Uncharacterized protein n=1 Tax=Vanilla planifolia TaxID=51239 RepID=A0A835RR66_VANPL|nr:hypothetical protein HPP92_007435 [Vanilla planifolia]